MSELDIVVLLKQVPDSSEPRSFQSDNTLQRAGAGQVINELDEYAVEAARRIVADHGGTITTLTMGPTHAQEAIRRALACGADAGVLIADAQLHGSCANVTARVLTAALKQMKYDLVLTGWEATDGQMGVIGPMCAELLAVPQLTGAQAISVESGTLSIQRAEPDAYTVVTASLPAVVSVTDTINEPRHPSFRDVMAARRKPITTLSVADLGISSEALSPTTRVLETQKRHTQREKQLIQNSDDVGQQIVEFLTQRSVL